MDEDDGPKGPLILVSILAISVILISIFTFDSCVNYEQGESYQACFDVDFKVDEILGQTAPCYDDEGYLYFSYMNLGEIVIEGVNVQFNEVSSNHTEYSPRLHQENIRLYAGTRTGVEFNHINITPIIHSEKYNKTFVCSSKTQKFTKIETCNVGTLTKFE